MSLQEQLNAETQVTLPELLKKMTDMGGSDLHITTKSPPQVRVHGHLKPIDGYEPFTPAETKRLAYSVLTDAQKHRFEEKPAPAGRRSGFLSLTASFQKPGLPGRRTA